VSLLVSRGLEKSNRLAVGRELKMIELKKEIERLGTLLPRTGLSQATSAEMSGP